MWLEILGGIFALLVLIYLYFKKNYQYWTSKGVYQIGNVQFQIQYIETNIDLSL